MGLGNKQKVQEIHWEPELTTALKNVFQIVPELHFNATIMLWPSNAPHIFACFSGERSTVSTVVVYARNPALIGTVMIN